MSEANSYNGWQKNYVAFRWLLAKPRKSNLFILLVTERKATTLIEMQNLRRNFDTSMVEVYNPYLCKIHREIYIFRS